MTQMEFEAHARRSDPATSHAAAASVTGIRDSQIAVLACLQKYGPCTDEQLQMTYNADASYHGWPYQSESGLRTRRKELVTRGLVRDSGKRERLLSGRSAIVWEVVPW